MLKKEKVSFFCNLYKLEIKISIMQDTHRPFYQVHLSSTEPTLALDFLFPSYQLEALWSFSGIRTPTHWKFLLFLPFLCKPQRWLCGKKSVNKSLQRSPLYNSWTATKKMINLKYINYDCFMQIMQPFHRLSCFFKKVYTLTHFAKQNTITFKLCNFICSEAFLGQAPATPPRLQP